MQAATSAPGCAAPRQGRSRISRPSSAAIGPAPIALPTWSSTTQPPRRTSHRKPPLGPARPRLLRPPPPLRPLAAPDRGQPGDRLGPREGAAAGGRGRSPRLRPPRRIRLRRRFLQVVARPSPPCLRPSRRDRPPLSARAHPARSPRCSTAARERSIPVSAAAWTRSRQMWSRSVRDGSGAAQPTDRPGEPEAGDRAWAVVQAAYGTRERVPWIERHLRAVLALAAAVALGVAAVSPPGRALVERVREAAGVTPSEPALARLPSSGAAPRRVRSAAHGSSARMGRSGASATTRKLPGRREGSSSSRRAIAASWRSSRMATSDGP